MVHYARDCSCMHMYMYTDSPLSTVWAAAVHDQSRTCTCICTRESKQGGKVSKAKSEGRQ